MEEGQEEGEEVEWKKCTQEAMLRMEMRCLGKAACNRWKTQKYLRVSTPLTVTPGAEKNVLVLKAVLSLSLRGLFCLKM